MRKNAHVSWDDLIFVLAVAEHGSVSAAARALSVNHATVLRRIAAFESRQGVRIFDRTPRGYQVSPDRRALIEAMQSAGAALEDVDRMIDAERPRLGAGLRITSTDTIAHLVLPSLMPELSQEIGAPVDLAVANTHLDFGRLEAHVTVRPAATLPDELEGERLGAFSFGVYATAKDTPGVLGPSGPLARIPAADLWRETAGECDVTADSFLALAALAASGHGRTILPRFVAEAWPNLRMVGDLPGVEPVPVWVASHVDFARSGRLVRARRFIAQQLRAHPAFSEAKAE